MYLDFIETACSNCTEMYLSNFTEVLNQNHIEKLKTSTDNMNLSLPVLVLSALGIIYSMLYRANQSSQAQMSTLGCGCYTGSQHRVGAHPHRRQSSFRIYRTKLYFDNEKTSLLPVCLAHVSHYQSLENMSHVFVYVIYTVFANAAFVS